MYQAKINSLENKRVFVIEDDVVNLAVIERILSKHHALLFHNYNSIGITVHVTENLPIDLVLLDINLRRGVNGYKVFEELRAGPLTAHIPVVAVTALDPESEIPKAKKMGFNGYISKPINSLTFADDLLDIINGQQKWVVS